MKGINAYLQTHPERWQDFVAAHELETTMSKYFQKQASKALLHEALSDGIHNPLEFCGLELPNGGKSRPYPVLLRDIGHHHRRKDRLPVSLVDVGRASAETIKDATDELDDE